MMLTAEPVKGRADLPLLIQLSMLIASHLPRCCCPKTGPGNAEHPGHIG